MPGNDPPKTVPPVASTPVARVALGWRAREVERESTVRMEFPDDDVSSEILENQPASLGYAEPAHSFVLPPGRFLRIDQAAGRVYSATATPHLDALTPEAAATLADSVARLLHGAGWASVPGEGLGSTAAVAAAGRYASDGQGGFGVSHVGTYRVPRAVALWARLPPNAPPRVREWDGVEATITVRPVRHASAEPARFIVEVNLDDQLLSLALQEQADVRRSHYGGNVQSLRGWDAHPEESIPARTRTPDLQSPS